MAEDLTGKRFGRLTVVSLVDKSASNIKFDGGKYWNCICDCGAETIVRQYSLLKGTTKSCGCLRRETARDITQFRNPANRLIDLTGKRFGKLTVIKRAENRKKQPYWLCKCDCGNLTEVAGYMLRNGTTKSCGCLRHRLPANFEDLTGQKFGKLTVLSRAEDHITKSGFKVLMWKCQCECGNITLVSTSNLKAGHVKSCGCLREELNNERRRKSKSKS